MVKTLHSKSATSLHLRTPRLSKPPLHTQTTSINGTVASVSKGKSVISTPPESFRPSQAQTNYQETTSSDTTSQTTSNDTIGTPKRTRGPTRNFGLSRINRINGSKYAVHISSEKRRPLHQVQSAKLSSTLGIISREHIPMPTRWTALTEDEIMPAFDFLTMKLDIVGFDREKETMVLDLLKNRTRTQRYRLHQRFLKHPTKQAALDDKPPKLTKENWETLCAYWSDPRVQERCEINRNNRSKLTVLHNQGSRAFVTLLHELGEKAGKQLDKIEFFPPTHCTDGKWTTSECEVRYKSMLDVQAKSIAEGNSKTANECYDEVMGVKSGYDKGFGYGPKPPRKNSSANTKKLEEALRDSQIENTRLKERLGAAETQLDEFNARLANQDKILKMILSQHNLQPPL